MNSLAKTTSRRSSRGKSPPPSPLQSDDGAITERLTISVFPSPLGWIGLLGQDEELISVFVGHSSSKSVTAAAHKVSRFVDDCDWAPEVRHLVEAYFEGEVVDFSQVAIRLPVMTGFRQQIVAATRRLGYGETATYGELARRVGHPRAARAVGTVMSTNRFPILIPCHRVVAAGGKLGGYTCPAGTGLKERLLELEGRNVAVASSRRLD